MRSTSLSAGLLLVAVVGVLAASRLGRPLGPTGIVLIIVLGIVAFVLLRNMIAARARRNDPDQWQAATKNVTPHEPALHSGAAPAPSAARTAPSIIVVESPDGTDRLAARLQALDRLRADGLVTAEEYEAKRAQLIADF